MRESDVVKMLDQFLEANGWVSFPQNSHVRHGRTRYKNGTPDILAMSPTGIFFGFEVKKDIKAKVSDNQKETLNKLGGGGYLVALDGMDLVAKWPDDDEWEPFDEMWLREHDQY